MRKLALTVLPAFLLTTAGTARADVLSLRVEGHLGGAGGTGLGGGGGGPRGGLFKGGARGGRPFPPPHAPPRVRLPAPRR